jgi:hypothetical protein
MYRLEAKQKGENKFATSTSPLTGSRAKYNWKFTTTKEMKITKKD